MSREPGEADPQLTIPRSRAKGTENSGETLQLTSTLVGEFNCQRRRHADTIASDQQGVVRRPAKSGGQHDAVQRSKRLQLQLQRSAGEATRHCCLWCWWTLSVTVYAGGPAQPQRSNFGVKSWCRATGEGPRCTSRAERAK